MSEESEKEDGENEEGENEEKEEKEKGENEEKEENEEGENEEKEESEEEDKKKKKKDKEIKEEIKDNNEVKFETDKLVLSNENKVDINNNNNSVNGINYTMGNVPVTDRQKSLSEFIDLTRNGAPNPGKDYLKSYNSSLDAFRIRNDVCNTF